jgi:hypothetical protein
MIYFQYRDQRAPQRAVGEGAELGRVDGRAVEPAGRDPAQGLPTAGRGARPAVQAAKRGCEGWGWRGHRRRRLEPAPGRAQLGRGRRPCRGAPPPPRAGRPPRQGVNIFSV